MIQTYFQGRVKIDQTLTIRFTDSDSSATKDVAFTEGTIFDSLDDFAEHLQTEIRTAGGNFADWTVGIIDTGEAGSSAGTVKISTGHAGLQVNFNQGGGTTGTNLRSYLNHNSDTISTGSATYYFNQAALATFYPSRSALTLTRSATSYDRIHMVTLGGQAFGQFSKDTDDVPEITLSTMLQFATEENDYSELSDFESFLDALFDNTLSGEPFMIHHGDDHHIVWFAGGELSIEYTRMVDGWNGAWQTELTMETYSEN